MPAEPVNITRAMDEKPIGSLLIQVAILCAMVAFLDGMDSTNSGIAAPLIAEYLKLSVAQLGPVFSASVLGAMVGSMSFGWIADRIGRKRLLVTATIIFGIFTFATAVANSLAGLLFIRFLAGIGLGGATPCFIALASEYAPRRHRAMVTSLIWTGVALGIVSGAFLNAFLISHFGWRVIFAVGGVLPVIVSLALMIWLPESIRFLLVKNRNAAEIRRIASRIVPSLPSDARIVADEEKRESMSIGNLFSEGRSLTTLPLWLSFLTVFGTATCLFSFAPSLLRAHGMPLASVGIVLGLGSMGALVGAAIVGRLIEKFGPTAVLAPGLVLGAATTAAAGYAANSLVAITIDLTINGVCLGGMGAAGGIALAAVLYPTAMRSTGVGWAMGMGRLGQVLMPLLASLLLAVVGTLDNAFLVVASAPCLGAFAILLLGRNRSRLRAAGATAA